MSAVLVGAGDIGDCATRGSQLTAQLLASIAGYGIHCRGQRLPVGNSRELPRLLPTRHGGGIGSVRAHPLAITNTKCPGAAPYFLYFAELAGQSGLGYYSYSLGNWRVFSLNSEVGYDAGSAQMTWLRSELSANPTRCALAYFHKPLFSSGFHGDQIQMREMWRTLYELGVDVVISAHDHNYERFAPQDFNGRFDPARGIRQFIVGTGGTTLRAVGAPRPNSEVHGSSWGVLVLTLEDVLYRWEFRPAEPGGFQDAGTGQCH